jgi:hypothetical protein
MGIVLLGLLLLASLPRGHGYCTCPDAGTCGVADLFSPGGDSECVPSAEGIIAADVAIENTAALATVDLSGVVAISGDLRFVGNAALVGIIATSLVLVDDDIIVRGNALLVNLNLPAFAGSVEDSDDILLVEQNPILEVVSLPSLIDSERDIQIGGNNANTGNPLLFTIDLSNLVTARGFMDFTGNARMEELLLGSLTTVCHRAQPPTPGSPHYIRTQIAHAPCHSVGRGGCQVGGYFYIGSTGIGSFNNLPALELPNLVSVGNHFFLQYLEEMSVLDLSSLESTGDYLIISAASSLVSLDLPAFTSAGGSIAGRAVSFDGPWDALQSINLPSL